MGHLRWDSRPGPGVTGSTHTVMLAAFTGWNDAANAASTAIDYLWDAWGAQRFGCLEPDEFVDFTMSRPTAGVVGGVARDLEWPETELGWCAPSGSLSVVLVRGPEPEFRWRQYCIELVDAADELGCSTLVTLGAMLSEVPHTRSVPVFCSSKEEHIVESLALPPSDYEGPVGIPAALADTAHGRGLESLGLWAAVPGYAAGVPSPTAALALVDRFSAIVGTDIDRTPLTAATEGYCAHLDELVAEDEDTAAYVRQLEQAYDQDHVAALGSADELVAEVEDYLRDQR